MEAVRVQICTASSQFQSLNVAWRDGLAATLAHSPFQPLPP